MSRQGRAPTSAALSAAQMRAVFVHISEVARSRAGYGVALLPRYTAVDDQGLVRVSPGERLPERDVWLLIRRDLMKVPRARTVADYLIDVFRRERRLLAG